MDPMREYSQFWVGSFSNFSNLCLKLSLWDMLLNNTNAEPFQETANVLIPQTLEKGFSMGVTTVYINEATTLLSEE